MSLRDKAFAKQKTTNAWVAIGQRNSHTWISSVERTWNAPLEVPLSFIVLFLYVGLWAHVCLLSGPSASIYRSFFLFWQSAERKYNGKQTGTAQLGIELVQYKNRRGTTSGPPSFLRRNTCVTHEKARRYQRGNGGSVRHQYTEGKHASKRDKPIHISVSGNSHLHSSPVVAWIQWWHDSQSRNSSSTYARTCRLSTAAAHNVLRRARNLQCGASCSESWAINQWENKLTQKHTRQRKSQENFFRTRNLNATSKSIYFVDIFTRKRIVLRLKVIVYR